MIVVDIPQHSDQWCREKLGKPSASNASKIIKNDGTPSRQRKGYLYELAGEIITGYKQDGYQNEHMIMGQEREDESRKLYEFIHDVEVKEVGCIYKDEKKRFLCSPDGIVEGSHGVELKNVLPKTQIEYLYTGKVPSKYKAQIQFSLYVTGFEFWDFMSYCPGCPPFVVRVKRDEKFIEDLDKEIAVFCDELDEIVGRITNAEG